MRREVTENNLALTLPTISLGGPMSLPGAIGSKLKGLGKGLEFATVLAQQASLGMHTPLPIATMKDVVEKLTGAILKATGKTKDENARSKLQSALTAALAPPGAGPPSADQLESRIQQLLTNLQLNIAGQKNELPGHILDADSAKEPPAPLKKNDGIDRDSIERDAAALTRALLQNERTQQAPQTSLAAGTALQAVTPQTQTPATAPADSDILSRIIGRAIRAGAQTRTASARPAITTPSSNATVAAPQDAFDRLVKSITAAAQQSAGDKQMQTLVHDQTQQAQAPAGAVPAGQAPSQDGALQNALPLQAHATTTIATTSALPQHANAPYTTVDASAVIEQIVKGIVVRNAGQDSQIRLRLQPEHLGEVSMKLTVSGNTISANVVTQNADVRQMLLSGQQQLSKSLAQSGLNLGGFSVDVSGGNASGGQQQSPHSHRTFKIGGWQMLDSVDEPVNDLRFGPPLTAGSQSMVLNYLA